MSASTIVVLKIAALIVALPLAAMHAEAGSPPDLRRSSATAAAAPRVVLPPTPFAKLKAAVYPADLGPETVDVSAYPRRIRNDYKIYARVCSQCHTLARANYSQQVERVWWTLYIAQMRARAAWKGAPLSPDEIRAILDFLEYDSRARKDERLTGFARTNEELTRRFNAEMDSRMQRLQKGPPVLNGQ